MRITTTAGLTYFEQHLLICKSNVEKLAPLYVEILPIRRLTRSNQSINQSFEWCPQNGKDSKKLSKLLIQQAHPGYKKPWHSWNMDSVRRIYEMFILLTITPSINNYLIYFCYTSYVKNEKKTECKSVLHASKCVTWA